MVSVNTAYSSSAYAARSPNAAAVTARYGVTAPATVAAAIADSATSVTLSDEAKAVLEVKDIATVLSDARGKLTELLAAAKRTSPLQDGRLALDLSTLDTRELFGIANARDDAFTEEEKTAAGLEMQRRFDAALAGPAAIARVTGNYAGLYKAAADYLDSVGLEERSDPKTIAARAALTEALKQLAADPKTLPKAGEDDPVALYLALAEADQGSQPRPIADVAGDVRTTLDKKYAEALANGRVPSFNKASTIGTYIDLSGFDSRSLSAMVLNAGNQFSTEEVSAATTAMRSKSGAALLAGYQNAARSGNPTAFSQNIISMYASMSTEERQAAGWSENFYQAAVSSYATTSKLTQMFADSNVDTSFMSWLGK